MSWLFGRDRPRAQEGGGEKILLGLTVFFKLEGEDLVVQAKVRTKEDLMRLKDVFNQMIEELLAEYEEQRLGAAGVRRFRSWRKAIRLAKKMAR